MRRHPIISFLSGFVIAALMSGAVHLSFLLLTFNLAGGENLSEIDSQNVMQLLLAFLLLIVAIGYTKRAFRNNKKITGTGVITVAVIVALAAISYFIKQNIYVTKFDASVWAASKRKPAGMAKSLVRQQSLTGLTSAQVKALLGQGAEAHGDINSDRGSILYRVQSDWTLLVFFQKDKVIEASLRLPYLGI